MIFSFVPAIRARRKAGEDREFLAWTELATAVLDEPPDYCYYESRRTLEEIRDAEYKANGEQGFKRAFRFSYE
jgi:antibiotic biosynthesis monooxygenase (ABM) superfamily enzyme